ncbi:MAG: glycosyltransferase involved in cell wall biosynthesis [Roseivirga sp.]
MKIAVNTRLLLKNKLDGMGYFSHEILQRLVRNHPEVEWLFIFDRSYHSDFIYGSNVKAVNIGPPSRHALLWWIWFQISIPFILRKHQVDLLLSPDGYIPTYGKTPALPVIHDINFEHQNHNLDPVSGAYMRYFFPRFAKRGRRVATVSNFSREDISKTYSIDKGKIDLVYNGVSAKFKALDDSAKVAQKRKWSAGCNYLLFIGSLNPRKNIAGMLAAYELYRKQGGSAKFILAGSNMLGAQEIADCHAKNSYQKDIIFTGRLDEEEITSLLGAAQALCFVSHFEGFGIPILEAFKSDCPVITANNTAMPEVAGAAAWLCDSEDAEDIAKAMLASDREDLRKDLILKGREQVKKFNWDKSAEMMWSSIQKCLNYG